MNWEQMQEIEPKLYHLRRLALAELCDSTQHDFWQRYERVKGQLLQIVGWYAGDQYPAFFRTVEAFDIAHREIFTGLA